MAPAHLFERPDGAKLALDRRFGRPDGAKLALDWRFGWPYGAKLALDRRFGRPDGAKLAWIGVLITLAAPSWPWTGVWGPPNDGLGPPKTKKKIHPRKQKNFLELFDDPKCRRKNYGLIFCDGEAAAKNEGNKRCCTPFN